MTQFKAAAEQARLAELTEQNRQQEQQAATLGKQIKKIQNQQVDVAAIEKIEAKPVPLLKQRCYWSVDGFESLATQAEEVRCVREKGIQVAKALMRQTG